MSNTTTSKKTGKPLEPLRTMTEAEVMAAALADPDAKPLTPDDFKRMKRIPRAKIIRRALGLTQEEFAARFRIPLGTLRDWEQGAAEPDQAARVLSHRDRSHPASRRRCAHSLSAVAEVVRECRPRSSANGYRPRILLRQFVGHRFGSTPVDSSLHLGNLYEQN